MYGMSKVRYSTAHSPQLGNHIISFLTHFPLPIILDYIFTDIITSYVFSSNVTFLYSFKSWLEGTTMIIKMNCVSYSIRDVSLSDLL